MDHTCYTANYLPQKQEINLWKTETEIWLPEPCISLFIYKNNNNKNNENEKQFWQSNLTIYPFSHTNHALRTIKLNINFLAFISEQHISTKGKMRWTDMKRALWS